MKSRQTLDIEHNRSLQKLAKVRDDAHELKTAIDSLNRKLVDLESRPPQQLSDSEYERIKQGRHHLKKMTQMFQKLQHNGDEANYFMITGDILFKYYDMIDNIGAGTNDPNNTKATLTQGGAVTSQGNPRATHSDQNRSVISYFNTDISPCNQTRVVEDRASLFDSYIQRISNDVTTTAVADVCSHCGSDHRTIQPQDGYVYCNKCNTMEYIIIDHEKPTFKDPPKDVTHFAYKRINHLNEWLNQVQGKESTEIPEDVFDKILLELKKQKVENMAMLTRKNVKEILKKLKINKYYEHIPHIINRLNGIPMPQLPAYLEDRVRQMFCQIQVPFLKHAPPNRKNFLSYSYCLNKMMQLLEEDQYLDSFPLLKSREKLHQQDVIWQKICCDLGWDFIPSL